MFGKKSLILAFVLTSFLSCGSGSYERTESKKEEIKINETTQDLINVIKITDSLYEDGTYMQKYIDEGADVNAKFQYSIRDYTAAIFREFSPLALACYKKEYQKVKVLLENGANVNYQVDKSGDTPLTLTLLDSRDHKETVFKIVELLLENGADPNLSRFTEGGHSSADGATPLIISISWNDIDVARLLLEAGADANKSSSDHGASDAAYGSTPLFLSTMSKNPELVQLLIDYGADINTPVSGNGKSRYSNGAFPLHQSVLFGDLEITRILIDNGAELNVVKSSHLLCNGANGSTPLGTTGKFPEITKLLLESGADPNIPRNIDLQISPLFSNAYSGSYRTIELLLDYGADVDFVTGCGTAIDGANIGNPDNKDEIIALLRANGCKTAKELGIEIDCEYYR